MTVLSGGITSPTYAANGVTRVWDYAFRVDDIANLRVEISSGGAIEQTLTSGFTATGVGGRAGSGQVTYPIAPAAPLPAGKYVRIYRKTAVVQEARIGNQGDFYPETHERAFDNVIMIEQEQVDRLDRTPERPPASDAFDFKGYRAKNAAPPVLPTDLATKGYADDAPTGPVQAAKAALAATLADIQASLDAKILAVQQFAALAAAGVGASLGTGVTRAQIPTLVVPAVMASLMVVGYATAGDAPFISYVRGANPVLKPVADQTGQQWNMVLPGYADPAWFGEKADNVTDDTNAIKNAMAAHPRTEFARPGFRVVSQTLYPQGAASIIGKSGWMNTILRRTAGHAGDTISCGSPGSGAGGIHVEGVWFMHDQGNAGPDTGYALPNRKTGGQAHLRIYGGSTVTIHRNSFDNLPFNVVIAGCTLVHITDNKFHGYYLESTASFQECIANVWLQNPLGSAAGKCQEVHIRGNSFGGLGAVPKVYGETINGVTRTRAEMPNAKFQVWAQTSEQLFIEDNYFGAANHHAVYLNVVDTLQVLNIVGNMFDATAQETIKVEAGVIGQFIGDVLISHNRSSCSGETPNWLYIGNPAGLGTPGLPFATKIKVHDNDVEDTHKSSVVILGGWDINIHDNSFIGYNYQSYYSAPDIVNCSAVHIGGNSKIARVNHNGVGGISGTILGGNYCVYGVSFSMDGTSYWEAKDNYPLGATGNPGLGRAGGSLVFPTYQIIPSAANIAIPAGGDTFRITGGVNVTSIDPTGAQGRTAKLFFDGPISFLGTTTVVGRVVMLREIDGAWMRD